LLSVLVVSGGGFQGLTLLKGLRESGSVRIIVADRYEQNVGRYFANRAYSVPPIAETDAFVGALLDICRDESVQLVLPSTDYELETLAKATAEFERRRVAIAVSEPGFLADTRDKRRLYAFLAREGFPVLEEVDPDSAADDAFPLIGKPRSGWGGRGILVVRAREDLPASGPEGLTSGYVWQRYLPGAVEYSADFAVDFARRTSPVVVRERVRTSGGIAVVAELARDPDAIALAERFAKRAAELGARGILNAQILRSGDELVLSDVNPRVGTSSVFANAAGVNLPLFLCASVGVAIEPGGRRAVRGPLRMIRSLCERWIDLGARCRVRGVVFDLDDTLIDHKQWIADKLEAVWAGFAGELPGRGEFLEAAFAILEEGNRAHLFDALAAAFGFDVAFTGRLIEAYLAHAPTVCAPFPDVRPALDTLRREGFALALLTDNPPASQRQKIAASGLAGCFDAVVFAREAGGEKPAPLAFVTAAAVLGLSPADLAMVGDNLYRDVLGALRAGYGAAFLVERRGGFYNYDRGLADRLSGPANYTAVSSLAELSWYLTRSGSPNPNS
jgi:FMN phosphatase YigB (HAD superfamily)/carbamoylphosphate synthase large subunit